MRLNLDANIHRHMTDGVVVLDRHGRVVSFNRAGEPWVPHCKSLEFVFRRTIDEERQGHLQLPMDLHGVLGRLNREEKTGLQAWLCKNGPAEYAVFLVSSAADADGPDAQAPQPTVRRPQFDPMALLGDGVNERLRQLCGLLRQMADDGPVPSELLQHTQQTLVLMQGIADLGTLAGQDEVFADERLDLLNVLAQVSEQLGPDAGPHYIRLHADVSTMAPVYGNGAWLAYALRSLLQSLLHNSGYRCAIHLTVKPLGDFVVVCGHISSPLPKLHLAQRTVASDPRADTPEWDLRELLCQRIVDLHGGKLKLLRNSNADGQPSLDAFTLTLMTGVPESDRSRSSCQTCRHVQQELAYAADLARVLSQSTTPNPGEPHHAKDTHR